MNLIGQRIQSARRKKRYTQDYVSAKANISEKFLSQIECGKAGLSVQTLISLCNILQVSPNYLLVSEIEEGLDEPVSKLLQQLTPSQLNDAYTILRLFVENCK